MFEDYYEKQVKRLMCELKSCESDKRHLLSELLNYTSKSITESDLREAVKNLYTAESETLARLMFDNRSTGVTLKELSAGLNTPVRKVKNLMTNLRNNGFTWYAYKESHNFYRYYLTGLNV